MKIKSERQRKLRIQQIIRDIRKKYLTFKLGKNENDETIRRLFKQITTRLDRIEDKQLAGLISQASRPTYITSIKHEQTASKKVPASKSFVTSTPKIKKLNPSSTLAAVKEQANNQSTPFLDTKIVAETVHKTESPSSDEDDDDVKNMRNVSLSVKDPIVMNEYLESYPPEMQDYVSNIWKPETGVPIDPVYGPRYDFILSKWFLGRTPINFDKNTNEIILDGKDRFPGTQGLYDLIFNNNPLHYTNKDKE
ncbi:hypothetical protein WA026_021338 [Henosepilachna vigintioctopunctata]|uniref:DUF8207 domain-containing protein n=1 Tax=Henosepilachna vigintioctopunctata TaxID=420089 RepID=A0AAW1UB66_9CUCU